MSRLARTRLGLRAAHHGVKGVNVALQLRGQAARLLRAVAQHVAGLLRVGVRVVHDAAGTSAVASGTARLLPQH